MPTQIHAAGALGAVSPGLAAALAEWAGITPTQVEQAVADYLAANPPTAAPDATSSVKGVIALTGDLGGTAAAPTVPGLAGKADVTDIIVGDPTGTNDHTLINAAIAQALTSGQPSRLIFSPGTYVCPSPLTSIADSSSIEFVGTGGRSPSNNWHGLPRTVISYTGTGSGVFLDATDTTGFTISSMAVSYTSASFTGTLIYAGGGDSAPAYSPKFRDSVFGHLGGTKTATILDLDRVVECSIQDCIISGGAVGIHGSEDSYSNVVNMIGGRFSECTIGVLNPRLQWNFSSVAFEPGCTVKSVDMPVAGLSFFGCSWWDNQITDAVWIDIEGVGLAISGGFWEPQINAESLVRVNGNFDGLSITGLAVKGLYLATEAPLLTFGEAATLTNLHFAGNSLSNAVDGFAAAQAAGHPVIHSESRALHEFRNLGDSGSSKAIPLVAVAKMVLTANCEVSLPWSMPGLDNRIRLVVTQDGTGSRTMTWPAAVKWAGGTAPTLTTTANRTDMFELSTVSAGTPWFGRVLAQNFDDS